MTHSRNIALTLLLLGAATTATQGADWSDTSLGWRGGTTFREPYNDQNIKKNIVNLTHVSGYAYGTNFFNVDMLISDRNDPARANTPSGAAEDGAQEVYVVYRHTLDAGKVLGLNLGVGPLRGFGLTAGGDLNEKADAGYGSKKRMLVVGPTAMFDVPGFLNVSVVALVESNQPYGVSERYTYKTHPALDVSWGMPFKLGTTAWTFAGYADYIAAKGDNEFGGATSPEIHLDAKLMVDVATLWGGKERGFLVGAAYEYWKNKFGNPQEVDGSLASTPMLRAEYHF